MWTKHFEEAVNVGVTLSLLNYAMTLQLKLNIHPLEYHHIRKTTLSLDELLPGICHLKRPALHPWEQLKSREPGNLVKYRALFS